MASPITVTIDTQLTTDTAIYASGDVLVATTAIALPVSAQNPIPLKFKVNKIELIDSSAQSGALDIVFLDQNKSLGAANAVAAISAADAKTVVHIESVTTAYVSLGANASAVTIMPYNGIQMQTAAGDSNIYVALISRSTKTYSATALYLRLSIEVL